MLTGPEIEMQLTAGRIGFVPNPEYIGPNSIDLRLGARILVVDTAGSADPEDWQYDPVRQDPYSPTEFTLYPDRLYLASTVEHVNIPNHAAVVYGRSSHARCGLTVHQTAGFIDQGFRGQITLELSVIVPLRIRMGERIAQIAFFDTVGEPRLYAGRYQNQSGATPQRIRALEGAHRV